MKKFFTLCMALLLGASVYAQERPERMVVVEKSGNFQGFLAERIDSVFFPKVEGRVAAKMEVLSVSQDTVKFKISRSLYCPAYKFMVIPAITANRLTDDIYAADFINKSSKDIYYNDFTAGAIPTAELDADTKYVAMTLGLDQYGIPCSVERAAFKTLAKPLIGDPKVTYTIELQEARKFALTFTPNADVKGYATVAGVKGSLQQQLEQWGPMLGYKNFGDMVKGFGYNDSTEAYHAWKDMEPNTEYELFIQAWDKAGTYAPCDTILIKTKKLGGEGEAVVELKLGTYELREWDGKMKYSQMVEFTPNKETAAYRYAPAAAKEYDKDPEGWQNSVKQEPPFPNIANWFFYEPMETDFQIEPNTEAVILAAGKNANGQWGKVTVSRFTTPDKTDNTTKSVSYSIKSRDVKGTVPFTLNSGKVPVVAKKGIKLTGK